MKKAVILILVAFLFAFACFGCTKGSNVATTDQTEETTTNTTTEEVTEESQYPEYLNMVSDLPIVNDGYDISLKVVTGMHSLSPDSEDIWFWKFAEEYMNIDFEVEQVSSEAVSERKNLMFASGDVPDLMIGILETKTSTTDIMNYGVSEKQLLALDEYINDYMPNLNQVYEEYPGAKAYCVAADGNMYAIPTYREDMSIGAFQRIYLRKSWLDALELEEPETLAEFIDVMYQFKEADVDGIGAENVVSMGGGFDFNNPTTIILQSMGYITKVSSQTALGGSGLNVAVRNGEATFPCNDELFIEYLTLCKKLYDEEILAEDFFLVDGTQYAANLSEGAYGFITEPSHVYLTEAADFQQYWAVQPLTSEWNDTPVTLKEDLKGISNIFIGADTVYPDVCARFLDMWFSDICFYMWNGPMDETEEALGYGGWAIIDGVVSYPDNDGSAYNYIMENIQPYSTTFGLGGALRNVTMYNFAGEEYEYSIDTNTETGGGWSNISCLENIAPYRVEGYPSIVYRSQEDNEMIADLAIVIEAYVEDQVAQFITGERSLDEFDDYLAELSDIGMDEYEQFFIDEYTAYLATAN
jgi:putative aldouronate transport system substrate-binding protein